MNRENGAPTEELTWQTVRRYSILTDAGHVVAGFSGGADSMVLVHFLWQAGTPLLAAHVNHSLRGKASNADEECMHRFCAERQIPLRVPHAGAAKTAAERHEGAEAAGRHIRYEFFESLCGPGDKIAMAHTFSDQTGAALLHLVRGTGTKDLCGIPPIHGRVIRPLIGLTREQVEEYCARYALPFVTGASNFSREYVRSCVRLDVIPALKETNPSLERAVGRMTHPLAEDEDCLSSLATQAVRGARTPDGWRTIPLSDLPRLILSRALRQIAGETGLPILTCERTEVAMRLLRAGSGKIGTDGEQFLAAESGVLRVVLPPKRKNDWGMPLRVPRTLTPEDGEVIIRTPARAEYEKLLAEIRNLLFHNALDYGTIKSSSIMGGRRPGDSFSPAGRGVTRSLKKLMNEEKVPISDRGGLLLLENSGQILWIESIGVAGQAHIRPDTGQIAYISVKECNS